jgi:hypothetical protein
MGLCAQFGYAPDNYESNYVRRVLDDLQNAGLIVLTADDRFEITSLWDRLHRAFRISLTELGRCSDTSLVVEPFLRRPDKLSNPPDLFVLMPFAEDLKPVFEDHIRKVAENLQLRAQRADNFFVARHIMSDIWDAICSAKAIIADCTGRNPNVFYEIGLAHTVGKPVILITQNSEDVPFDLRSIRYINYKFDPRGMKKFENMLAITLRDTLGLSTEE